MLNKPMYRCDLTGVLPLASTDDTHTWRAVADYLTGTVDSKQHGPYSNILLLYMIVYVIYYIYIHYDYILLY